MRSRRCRRRCGHDSRSLPHLAHPRCVRSISVSAFSELLKAAQEKNRDLTQTDIADATGTTQQTVSRWMAGKILPPVRHVPALAKVLRISERKLMDALMAASQEEREMELTLPRRVARLEERLAALEAEVREKKR